MGGRSFVCLRQAGLIVWSVILLVAGHGCQKQDVDQLSAQSSSALDTNHHARARHKKQHLDGYHPDCNDPDDLGRPPCIDPTEAVKSKLKAEGYPYYVGHAEPTLLFFSNTPSSANAMQWRIKLPATDPTPSQDGGTVANFELMIAFWFGAVLCDPTSKPYNSCTPNSDANDPSTAGSAYMELQFYPPGTGQFVLGCSNTQWCAALATMSFHDNNPTVVANCLEPIQAQKLTTNGSVSGPVLLMSNGDDITITIKDTVSGLSVAITDNTSLTTGSMVASAANGYLHNANTTDCTKTAFNYHPLYQTASATHTLLWGGVHPNVAFATEIGHWELCGNSSCSTKPDGNDGDETLCGTVRGVGGCADKDGDQDGVSYKIKWPDGTSFHPGSIIIGSPNNKGVGPMSRSASSANAYTQGYDTISFRTTEPTNTLFYPFFNQTGVGTACRFNFGNDSNATTADFGKTNQYGLIRANPCFPDPSWTVPVSSLLR